MLIPKGKLIAIGGNEDKGNGIELIPTAKNNVHYVELGILKRILQESKGIDSRIEIIPTASQIPDEVGESYLQAFDKLGCSNISILNIKDREDAKNPYYLERLKDADAVLFTGGNQLRLTMIFGGSEFQKILTERYLNEDFVIAGTSAGAMAMSHTMIYHGNTAESLLKGEVRITTGLALIKDVIIDTHFVNRGRFGRLAEAVAGNPSCIGIGLGEDTGLLIHDGNIMEAIGSGLVIIVDGYEIGHTNIADINDGTPLSIENLVIHVLAKGNSYNLQERKFYAKLSDHKKSEFAKVR